MDFACKKINVEDIIACSLGLKKSEYKVFAELAKHEKPITVVELAHKTNLDRTSIQKLMKTFLDKGLINRYQLNLSEGGYRYNYKIKEKIDLRKLINKMIDEWANQAKINVNGW